jgi:hypothetical protein
MGVSYYGVLIYWMVRVKVAFWVRLPAVAVTVMVLVVAPVFGEEPPQPARADRSPSEHRANRQRRGALRKRRCRRLRLAARPVKPSRANPRATVLLPESLLGMS